MSFMNTSLQKACDLVGAVKLAALIGVTPQAISDWKNGKRPIPLDRCAQIESATNIAVCCEELRPDKRDFWAYMRKPGANPRPTTKP
jgi:DNA-binding transcriptional regulator YdaS (Cro superfamily)